MKADQRWKSPEPYLAFGRTPGNDDEIPPTGLNRDSADAIAHDNAEALGWGLLCAVGLGCFVGGCLFTAALALFAEALRGVFHG